ncbi:MAG TPA: exodeoxyribonuclease VII large subunit [Candidatus Aphodocola excrementigallinarum]|uniref:Exodeoxyribonuclease 7 large subunit n=1 Tax=Candidatus Aphodocola excrementigallinarum TaxID=2840670 RepID=A0A9D1LIA1_9FIRM|nr:exodeoxyribonuclease VII large subunit [Candidatus Aphodocola excrementigallinarum]
MQDKYISVTALTRYIKFKIDNDVHLQEVYLKGEISNFKAHTRGHFYFTIKDETSRINAIMFSYNASKIKFTPEDGMKVLVKGKISVFETTGNYQIYVEEMQEDGVGNLYVAFEQLKKKLGDEGLFDAKYKKPIPKIPMRVGIVTAPTGAAVKDILSTIKRRFPICETILFPCLVQGELAKDDIVKKLDIADNYDLDVIILGRGGGSIEDLWPFNEEVVARKVFNCKTPIISGVGHQIDFTICDFVADVRAETPTGAAERAVPMLSDLLLEIDSYKTRYTNAVRRILDNNKLRLKKLKESYILKNPLSMYEIKEQKLDNIIDKLNTCMNAVIYTAKSKLEIIENSIIFKDPKILYDDKLKKTNHLIEKLELLNPLNAIKRGYSITKKDNKCITSIKDIKKDDNINVMIKDGEIKAKVMEVKNG